MKAGSTSLHDYLNLHPSIFMSERKEIDFFVKERNYSKGLEWYKAHFPEKALYRGESSINYTKQHVFKNVPERIKNDLGEEVKFIYIVRNPVDRFVSNFTDSKTYGHIPPSFSINDFVKDLDSNPLIKTSLYNFQISEYIENFSRKNFLFIKSDRLKNYPEDTMREVFHFLGLEAIILEKEITRNSSGVKTYPSTLGGFLSKNPLIQNLKRKISPAAILQLKKALPFTSLTRKRIDGKIDRLSPENYSLVQNYLREDILSFGKMSNLDISDWIK